MPLGEFPGKSSYSEEMLTLLETPITSDIAVDVDGRQLALHKVILSAASANPVIMITLVFIKGFRRLFPSHVQRADERGQEPSGARARLLVFSL